MEKVVAGKPVCRIFIESTIPHARRHHALLIRLVLLAESWKLLPKYVTGEYWIGILPLHGSTHPKWISRKSLSGRHSDVSTKRKPTVTARTGSIHPTDRWQPHSRRTYRLRLISPYKAQVQYLRNKIKADASLKPYRSLFTVNTVDGFQGQERDVIFISLVRANEEGR